MKPEHENLLVLILEKILREEEEQTKLLRHNIHVSEKTLHLAEKTLRILETPHTLTAHSYLIFSGATMPSTNAVTLNVGQTSQISVANFLADGVTPSGGVVSALAFTFSDPSATVVANPDGATGVVTGVAASTGAVSGSASYTVTDTDGVVSQWTTAFTVTTNAVPPPPTQLTQSSSLVFSDPQ